MAPRTTAVDPDQGSLFGVRFQAPRSRPVAALTSAPSAPSPPPVDVAALAALGLEVVVVQPDGVQVCLVPEYGSAERGVELKLEHAATLALLCGAFPGARVYVRPWRPEPAAGAP